MEGHAGEDAGACHEAGKGRVELRGKIGCVGTTRGEDRGPVDLERGDLADVIAVGESESGKYRTAYGKR